jgi:hypothetical protein
MVGEPDYATILLALTSIPTEWRWQQMILMANCPCSVCILVVLVLGEGEENIGALSFVWAFLCVGDLLNSYIDHSIKLCMYVDNIKFKLAP